MPDGLVAYGRFLPTYTTEPRYLYVGEGMNSSIAVSEEETGARNFHVAGKVEASSYPPNPVLDSPASSGTIVHHRLVRLDQKRGGLGRRGQPLCIADPGQLWIVAAGPVEVDAA